MTKIMLVEDDKSLREIYGVRLLAEGYDIVSASDGEEALAMAIKERPKLIVTDVMMPKISGFDMLDILRSTTETRDIKVIMMTALGSDDHRVRGEQMGADRYLVKSQVGIEDVVRVVHEVLGDRAPGAPGGVGPAAPPTTAPPVAPPPAAPISTPAPQQASPAQAMPAPQQSPAMAPVRPAPIPAPPIGTQPVTPPVTPQQHPAAPVVTPTQRTMPPISSTTPAAPSTRQRIIQPIGDPAAKVNINELLDKELAKEAGIDTNNRPPVATTAQEKAIVQNQLNSMAAPQTVDPVTPGVPTIAIDQQGNVTMPRPAATAPAAPAVHTPPVPQQAPAVRPAAPAPKPPERPATGPVQAPPRQNPPAAAA